MIALALVGIASVVAAPGVPATCARVLELAALAGESVEPADRSACEARYQDLRATRGPLGWAWLSWCTRWAATIPEAARC